MAGRSRNIIKGGGGQGGKGRISSRVHERKFCISQVTKQMFMFSRFSTKMEVVQNVKNVTLVPFQRQSASIIF